MFGEVTVGTQIKGIEIRDIVAQCQRQTERVRQLKKILKVIAFALHFATPLRAKGVWREKDPRHRIRKIDRVSTTVR